MRLPGARSAALGAALLSLATLATLGCAGERGALVDPVCSAPMVVQATVAHSSANVLSAFVTADVREADSVVVRFGVTALDSVTPALVSAEDSVLAPVYGLLPSTSYRLQLVAINHCGTAMSAALPFTTEPLPLDLPTYAASGPGASPGYVAFAAGKYGLAIDNTGRVVWYHRFENGPGLNFQPQPDGRYAARPSVATGQPGSWVELAPDGAITRTLTCAHDFAPRMHDLIAEPDGSYWLLCDDVRTRDLSGQGKSSEARVMGTDVQWRSATGDVLFEWSPFDHLAIDLSVLASADRDATIINWTHGNALDLDGDGNLVVSYRNLSQVTKIDTRTGAVIWRMGGAQNQFTLDGGDFPSFIGQHGLRVAGSGQLILLDNLGDPVGSRAERFELDELHRTARLLRSYAATPGVIAQIGGSTQPLPNGHTLVSFGNGGGLAEYDTAGVAVWQLAGNPGYIFRATRIRSLYHPGVGDPR